MLAPSDPDRAPGSALAVASVWTLLATAASFALAIVQGKVSAVVLGTAGLGVLGNLASFIPLVAALAFALAGQAAVREIAAARARGDTAEVGVVVRYATVVPLSIGTIGALVTAALAAPLAALVLGDPTYAPLIVVTALALPPVLAAMSYRTILQGLSEVVTLARASIVGSVAATAAMLASLLVFGLVGAVAGLALGAVLQLAVFVIAAPNVARLAAEGRRMVPRELRTVAAFGAASLTLLAASNGVTLLIRGEVARRLGLEAAGLYQPIAIVSDTYVEMLIGMTAVYLFPRLTELLARGAHPAAAREIQEGLRLLLLVTTPVLLFAVAFSEPLLALLYAPAFAAAAPSFDLQMVGNVSKVVAWSVGAALLPGGYVRAWLLIGLVTVGLRYALTLALIGDLGLVGVAAAYDVAWTWAGAAGAWVVLRVAGLGRGAIPLLPIAVSAVAIVALVLAKAVAPAHAPLVAAAGFGIWLVHAQPQAGALVVALRQGVART